MKDAPRIQRDPAVLGGEPVFAGTRLPVATLLACMDAGNSWERIVASWPWVTLDHVRVAREWVASQKGASRHG